MIKISFKIKLWILISIAIFIISTYYVYSVFIRENAYSIPTIGGTLVEGSVGNITSFNPLFVKNNSINSDILSLIFSGLTRYDPETQEFKSDLATYTIDETKKIYEFQIKENIQWHDGTDFTVDDIIFTYNDIIKNENFTNITLKNIFKDIEIIKIDDKKVQFILNEPYYFFPSLLTVSILPKHIWYGTPINEILNTVSTNTIIGTGPYIFKNMIKKNDYTQVEILYNKDYFDINRQPKIENIVFKIFPSDTLLYDNITHLDSINNVAYNKKELLKNNNFSLFGYYLPQYVAVFINMQDGNNILNDTKVRLALSLATDKNRIIDMMGNAKKIDSPFLEQKETSWQLQYEPNKAQGALFDAGWKFIDPPVISEDEESEDEENEEDIDIEEEMEENNTEENLEASMTNRLIASTNNLYLAQNSTYKITHPNNGRDFSTNENYFIIRGTNPKDAEALYINSYRLRRFTPSKGTWSYIADTNIGTLKLGENTYNAYYMKNGERILIDTLKITYDPNFQTTIEDEDSDFEEDTEEDIEEDEDIGQEEDEEDSDDSEATDEEEDYEEEIDEEEIDEEETIDEDSDFEEDTEEDIDEEDLSKYRQKDDRILEISILVPTDPPYFYHIAEILKENWNDVGIKVNIEVEDTTNFTQRLLNRDYDTVIFGQSLDYNLDTYPFWHSTQTKEGGLNLSNLSSYNVNNLLDEIRNPYLNKMAEDSKEEIERLRQGILDRLERFFEENTPAIFLLSPEYYYAVKTNKIKNVKINNLALFKDRFLYIHDWYISTGYVMKDKFTIKDIINYIYNN